MFSLIGAWMNGWVNNREAGDLRHHRAHSDVAAMIHDYRGVLYNITKLKMAGHYVAGFSQAGVYTYLFSQLSIADKWYYNTLNIHDPFLNLVG